MSIHQTIKPGTRVRVLIGDSEHAAVFRDWTRTGNAIVHLQADGNGKRVIVSPDAISVIS